GDDLDFVGGEEGGQVVESRRTEDRQVAAVDHMRAKGPRLGDQPSEVGVQFGCAAGDVDDGDLAPGHGVKAVPHRLARHHLAAVGAGVDVAVPACLVAELADV